MAKQTTDENKPKWLTVELETMPKDAQKAHGDYKAAYAVVKGKREAFEKHLNAALRGKKLIPDGHTAVIGYKFGKVSVAKDAQTGALLTRKIDKDGKTEAESISF